MIYKDKKPVKKIPFYEAKQVILTPGNNVSTSALFWCSVYGVPVMLMSNTGRPLSTMAPMMSLAHIDTRVKQYEALYNPRGVEIAKAIVNAKIQNQVSFLERRGLDGRGLRIVERLQKIKGERIGNIRSKLTVIESRCSRAYFRHLKTLFPDFLQTPKRTKYHAKDPLNNLFNLGYEVLKGEVYRGVMYSHLDPYFGYLHTIQPYKLSLVYDFQELFRGLIDEFLVEYTQKLSEGDFERKGDRTFLKQKQSYKMIKAINRLFDKRVKQQRMYKFGEHSKIRTAMGEEPRKLAQYLRGEKERYEPVVISKYIGS